MYVSALLPGGEFAVERGGQYHSPVERPFDSRIDCLNIPSKPARVIQVTISL